MKSIICLLLIVPLNLIAQFQHLAGRVKNIQSSKNQKLNNNVQSVNSKNNLDSTYLYSFSSNSDSVVYEKDYYKYDLYGNVILTDFCYRSQANKKIFIPLLRRQFEYDSKGNKELEAQSDWFEDYNKWVVLYKYEDYYDENGNDTLSTYYEHDNNYNTYCVYKIIRKFSNNKLSLAYRYHNNNTYNNLQLDLKNEYIYNSNQTTDYEYYWDTLSGTWINKIRRITYDYLDSIKEFDYTFNSKKNDWDFKNLYLYAFNINKKLTLKEISNWDSVDNKFDTVLRIVYYYNLNNKDSLRESYFQIGKKLVKTDYEEFNYDKNGSIFYQSYSWDDNIQSFKGRFKYDSIYNDLGKLSLYFGYKWDDNLMSWLPEIKIEKKYNNNNKIELICNSTWDNDLKDWLPEEKRTYLYDSNNNNLVESVYSWNKSQESFIISAKFYNFYSGNTLVNEIAFKDSSIKLYPNPTHGILNISTNSDKNKFYLYNSSGQLISCAILNIGNNTFDVGFLKSGLYNCNVVSKEKRFRFKIIKQ